MRWVVLGILGLGVFYIIRTYNLLVSLRHRIGFLCASPRAAAVGGIYYSASATRSISMRAPLGSSATATVERAGFELPKYSA